MIKPNKVFEYSTLYSKTPIQPLRWAKMLKCCCEKYEQLCINKKINATHIINLQLTIFNYYTHFHKNLAKKDGI